MPGALGLFVRMALPKGGAKLDLSGNSALIPTTAVALLRAARSLAAMLGVSFHVGSQCLDPLAWRDALALAGEIIRASGVEVDVDRCRRRLSRRLSGPGAAAVGAFFAEIEAGFERLNLPGTSAVGGARPRFGRRRRSVVVQVQAAAGRHAVCQ